MKEYPKYDRNPVFSDSQDPEPISENDPESPSSGEEAKVTIAPSPKKRYEFFLLLQKLWGFILVLKLIDRSGILGEECRREWCQFRSEMWRDPRAKEMDIHRLIRGIGGSTAKNPSKGLHFPGLMSSPTYFLSIKMNMSRQKNRQLQILCCPLNHLLYNYGMIS